MSAFAIIQGGDIGHPFAPPWYESNPVEPIGDGTISVKDSTVIKDITLDSVMDAILQKKADEVIVVCHGSSEGLAIPMYAGGISALGAQKNQLSVWSEVARSDKFVAEQYGTTEELVRNMRAKMKQVQDSKLKHLAFRACEMGQSTDTMEAFRAFFGATSVSAPKMLDSYGDFSAALLRKGEDLEDWVKYERKKQLFHIWIDQNVGFGVKHSYKHNTALAYDIVCKAVDAKAFSAWQIAHISDAVKLDRRVVYHGIMDVNAAPADPAIFFVRDADFISNIVLHPAK